MCKDVDCNVIFTARIFVSFPLTHRFRFFLMFDDASAVFCCEKRIFMVKGTWEWARNYKLVCYFHLHLPFSNFPVTAPRIPQINVLFCTCWMFLYKKEWMENYKNFLAILNEFRARINYRLIISYEKSDAFFALSSCFLFILFLFHLQPHIHIHNN